MQRSAPVKVTAAVGVQYLVGRVEWSVPEEQRLKGSVWPVAGRLLLLSSLQQFREKTH